MEADSEDTLREALEAEAGLRGVARALLNDADAAEDAVQTAWLRWIQHGRGAPLPFLKRAVRNAAIDRWRGARRRRAREVGGARAEALPSAAEMVAGEQERRRLWAAVHDLDEPYRGTLWLRFYEDLEPREIARRLEIPVETVRTRTRRGLAILRERLEREGGEKWRQRLALAFGLPWLLASTSPLPLLAGGALAAGLCLGIVAGWPWSIGSEASSDEPRVVARVGTASAASDGPSAGDEVAADSVNARRRVEIGTESATPAAFQEIEVVHADGRPAVDLPVWLWDRPRPRQAWLPDREPALGTPRHGLSDPPRDGRDAGLAGWTDRAGICRLRPGQGFGVTVGLDDWSWVSFQGAPQRVVLPPLGDVRFDVLPPSDSSYSLRLYPAVLEGPADPSAVSYAMTDVRTITTASGPAVLFLESRLLTDLDGSQPVTVPLPEGQLFAVEADAFPLRIRARETQVRAPGRIQLEVVPDQPSVRVELVDADGAPCEAGGLVRIQPVGAEDGRSFGVTDLEQGQALLTVVEPDVRNEVVLVLEDGALFRAEVGPLDVGGDVLRFVRGAELASTGFRLPVGSQECHFVALVFDLESGVMQCVAEPPRLYFLPGEPICSWKVEDDRLRVWNPPAAWRRAWLCADDGRLLRIERDLPDAAAEPVAPPRSVDVGEIHETRGRPDYARYLLALVFRDAHGEEVFAPLRWARVDPLTDSLPVWSLRQPSVAEARLRASGPEGWIDLGLPR